MSESHKNDSLMSRILEINETILLVLYINEKTKKVELGKVNIDLQFKETFDKIKKYMFESNITLDNIIEFLKKINETNELKEIEKDYKYCIEIEKPYQGIKANLSFIIDYISRKKDVAINILQRNINSINWNGQLSKYEKDKKINKENTNYKSTLSEIRNDLNERFINWQHAYSIEKAYEDCRNMKNVFIYSHRVMGWSNPVFKLNNNFTIEIKTNFGFGNSSYFFTIVKYKNITICPISQWVFYEFAKFAEIIRYTQKYNLENKYWYDAINYAMKACNSSIENEDEFIEKYIIKECEEMVTQLESILEKSSFKFYDEYQKEYIKDKFGHILIEYRGEKISGALDFIIKIIEFEKITAIKNFIDRIIICNKTILPILVKESTLIVDEIKDAEQKLKKMEAKFENLNKIKLKTIEKENKQGLKGIRKTQNEINKKSPQSVNLNEDYISIQNGIKEIKEHINNLIITNDKIQEYSNKIQNYFQKINF